MENYLKYFRLRAGLNAPELGKKVGASRHQIYRLEADDKELSSKWAAKLAPHLGISEIELMYGANANKTTQPQDIGSGEFIPVPVVGSVSAGIWLESQEVFSDEPQGFGGAMRDPRFPKEAYFALLVNGESINKRAKNGTYLICVDINKADIIPQIGDVVIVQRMRDQGGLIETTAKILIKNGEDFELHPYSSHEKHQAPIAINMNSMDGNDEIRVIAVATGSYETFDPRFSTI